MGEAVQHGLNGYLCAPTDIPKWREQIETIVANPALRVEVGRRAKDFAHKHFSIDSMASSTIAIYGDVIRSYRREKIA